MEADNKSSPQKKQRRKRKKFRIVPGAPPGTLNIDPNAPKPIIKVFAYGVDKFVEETITSISNLTKFLNKFSVVWINIEGLGDEKTLLDVGHTFEIHPLVLEDIIHVNQRPKVEFYNALCFVVSRMFHLNDRLESEQFSVLFGKKVVLTFQESPGDCLDPIRERIRKNNGRIRKSGADYLAYAILDALTDNYFPIIENYAEKLDQIEDQIFSNPDKTVLDQIHHTKRELQALRRVIFPMRDVLSQLAREDSVLIKKETQTFLRDCYDHIVQIMDLVDTYKENGSELSNFYLSSLSQKMNEIMKVLTMIATLFIPLSFVAGLYGMNFNPEKSPLNMPELNWYWGYPFALGIMALISVGMIWYFNRKGWIGGDKNSS